MFVAIAEELPDVFYSEILPKLDGRATLNLAQVSKWYNDAVWSVEGVRSLEEKMPHSSSEPLNWAAYCGNVPAVRALLKSGVDVDMSTPLHCAAQEGHTPVVKALIEAGADVDKEVLPWLHISAPCRRHRSRASHQGAHQGGRRRERH